MTGRRLRAAAWLLVAVTTVVGGCRRGAGRGAGGAPTVSVTTAREGTVPDRREYVGTVRAVDEVDVRARVRGFLLERSFVEGQLVHAGQLLFRIDPSTYEVKLLQARSDVARAKATLTRAQRDFRRTRHLFEEKVASQSDLDAQQAARDEAAAAVASANAAVAAAELDLSYCTVRAPFTGRIGLAQVDVGNLVGQNGQDTVLAHLVQVDPIHVYFAPSEADRLGQRYIARPDTSGASGGEAGDGPPSGSHETGVPVEIRLGDGSLYPARGVVDYVDPTVDATRGTVTTRAVVPNPDGVLKPGQFVRVVVVFPPVAGVLVPERALQEQQGGSYVLVVRDDDTVEFRNVMPGVSSDGMRQIAKGLSAGERVIVDGVQKARAGAKVKPEEAKAAAEGAKPPIDAEAKPPVDAEAKPPADAAKSGRDRAGPAAGGSAGNPASPR
jgi:membrane fusion protein (multidrug efflux system)